MNQELWDRLKQEPNASKSTLEIEHERSQREYQASLQGVKPPVITAAARQSAIERFRSIQAMNAAEKATAELDIVNQRTREIQQQIAEALKDVASPAEQSEILQRAQPLLRRFATALDDYSVTEWVGHQMQALRAERAAKELAGY